MARAHQQVRLGVDPLALRFRHGRVVRPVLADGRDAHEPFVLVFFGQAEEKIENRLRTPNGSIGPRQTLRLDGGQEHGASLAPPEDAWHEQSPTGSGPFRGGPAAQGTKVPRAHPITILRISSYAYSTEPTFAPNFAMAQFLMDSRRRTIVIILTRLNGATIGINPDLVTVIDVTPDTTISLLNGDRIIARESLDEVIDRLVAYRQRIGAQPVNHVENLAAARGKPVVGIDHRDPRTPRREE